MAVGVASGSNSCSYAPLFAKHLGPGTARGYLCCCMVWGRNQSYQRHSIFQIFDISRKYLIPWDLSRGSISAYQQCPAFSCTYTISTSLSFQTAEQDRLRAKSGQGDLSCWLHYGLGQGVPGLFQGQLDSQLLAAKPFTCGRETSLLISLHAPLKAPAPGISPSTDGHTADQRKRPFVSGSCGFVNQILVTLASL